MADIAFANNRSARLISENRNTANITTAVWSGAYGGINEINLTLAALPLVTDATPADVTRLDGELKFMRAFLLFELVRNYSYIPTFVVRLRIEEEL
ncbi:MAG: RagB/SusD family nutrient uptake outer membrane protein [Chitinophagaceae bacterium]|nr:RagB/SusD family nutrient uptake outer membrane protein [Chitinophagaceae bacterium]